MGKWLWCLLGLIGLTFAQGPEKRRTGNVCSVDMDCPDNAFCRQSSYCVCKDGFVYAAVNSTNKGCLKEARIGEPCVQHIQCHMTMGVHSECVGGACACEATSHLEDDRCYETAVIGERCVVDQNCYLGEEGVERQAFCVRGYCTCQLQYSPRDNGTRCVRDASLGEPCEDELQCAGAGLECRGTCRCRDRWVANNHTNSCLEAVTALNDPCDYDVQCRRDEECVSEEDEPGYCHAGRCTCKTCSPDVRDFDGGASTLSRPPILVAVIVSIAAILRQH